MTEHTRSTEIKTNSVGLRLTRCVGPDCGADVVWAETLAGKRTPLDPEPAENGTIAVDDRGSGRYIANVFSGKNLASVRFRGTPPLYRSHWATCPNAETFRSR